MADDQESPKQDLAELARAAADAVTKLAVEVGHMVADGVRSAWEATRAAGDGEGGQPGDAAGEDGATATTDDDAPGS